MSTQVFLLKYILVVNFVSALRVLSRDKSSEATPNSVLLKIIDALAKPDSPYEDRRMSNHESRLLSKVDSFLNKHASNSKHLLRQQSGQPAKLTPGEQIIAKLKEKELEHISRQSSQSELLQKPFLQKQGRNDFLVIQSDSLDPFVTIVPNSIYYEIEKKCVNWLDACSLKGIRNHLLSKVMSPYK